MAGMSLSFARSPLAPKITSAQGVAVGMRKPFQLEADTDAAGDEIIRRREKCKKRSRVEGENRRSRDQPRSSTLDPRLSNSDYPASHDMGDRGAVGAFGLHALAFPRAGHRAYTGDDRALGLGRALRAAPGARSAAAVHPLEHLVNH